MIDRFQALCLALVQGLTEFLPISSSGHLILVPSLLGWPDQGLAFDVAVHVGSLLAVVVYFRTDLIDLAGAVPDCLRNVQSPQTRLLYNLSIASIPVLVAGLVVHGWIEENLRGPLIVASTMAGFAVVLLLADRTERGRLSMAHMSWYHALFIGVAQVLALIPGTSRSGITLTAALFAGISRTEAARFSFLLSIPVIVAAGALNGIELLDQPNALPWDLFLLGILASGVSAYACIALFLRLIESIGMLPFVVYRLLLAGVLFWMFT